MAKGKKRDSISTKTARIMGLSYDYVRRVRNGERENEKVMEVVMMLREGESRLIKEIEKIVPLDTKNSRKGRELTLKKG